MELSDELHVQVFLSLGKNPPVLTVREAGWILCLSGRCGEQVFSCPCREPNTCCPACIPSLHLLSYPGSSAEVLGNKVVHVMKKFIPIIGIRETAK
jgi:hypothetical protein